MKVGEAGCGRSVPVSGHLRPRGQRRGGQPQARRITGVPSERPGQMQSIRLQVEAIRVRRPGGHCGRGDAYLAARALLSRLPAAVAARGAVEAPAGPGGRVAQRPGLPSVASCRWSRRPRPQLAGISSRRLISYWPPLRSGLCHTRGRTWIWVLALG